MFDFIGKKLGPYEIGEPIGQGGMATVYKAFQASMNRTVAIKVLPPLLAQNATFLARFKQEAQVIARLEHAHILPVYDYGESDGVVYIVMRYLDGGSLQKQIDSGRMPLREVSKYLSQVASALDYAHQQGVIHRDMKPSNVLLDRQGNSFLTDFGIAKMMAGTMDLTGTGVIGTPQYMSPEQGQGLEVGARSDVYSLGVLLYELLTGRLPYEADTPLAVVVKHVTEPLPSVRTFAPELPPAVETVLSRALAKRPADRYATAGEFSTEFDEAIRTGFSPATKPQRAVQPPTHPSGAVLPTLAAPRPIRLSRRVFRPLLAGGLLVVLIALIALASAGRTPDSGPSAGITADPNIVPVTPLPSTPNVSGGSTPVSSAASDDDCHPILVDDFGDPASGFPRGENNSATWGYLEGEYRMLIKLANEFEARVLRQEFTDYALEVDAHFASATPGHYGLALVADAAATRYYAFVIDEAQHFAVTLRDVFSGSVTVRDWMFAPSLNAGDAVNRLRAVRKEDTLALYGNGVLLAVITDTLDVPVSRVGFTAASSGSGSVDARFDNFRVCRAPESLAPSDVSLIDAFDDDRNQWGAVRYAGGLAAFIEDGQFQLSVPYQDPRLALFHWNPTFAAADFELEVDSRILEGSGGARAGVMFGIQDFDNSYLLYASADRRLTFYRRVDGSQQAIVLDQPHDAIAPADAVNRWSIRVSNGLLTVFLNGDPVLQASIAYTPGAIGFACEPDAPPLARCAFDNLSVRGEPATSEVILYPFCNCLREMRVGQPGLVAWTWTAADADFIGAFLSAIDMEVRVDGQSLDDPAQYWGAVEPSGDGVRARWAYALLGLDPGSHIVEVSVRTDVEVTDGRDANADGRPDTFGPGQLFAGFVQIVVVP